MTCHFDKRFDALERRGDVRVNFGEATNIAIADNNRLNNLEKQRFCKRLRVLTLDKAKQIKFSHLPKRWHKLKMLRAFEPKRAFFDEIQKAGRREICALANALLINAATRTKWPSQTGRNFSIVTSQRRLRRRFPRAPAIKWRAHHFALLQKSSIKYLR